MTQENLSPPVYAPVSSALSDKKIVSACYEVIFEYLRLGDAWPREQAGLQPAEVAPGPPHCLLGERTPSTAGIGRQSAERRSRGQAGALADDDMPTTAPGGDDVTDAARGGGERQKMRLSTERRIFNTGKSARSATYWASRKFDAAVVML